MMNNTRDSNKSKVVRNTNRMNKTTTQLEEYRGRTVLPWRWTDDGGAGASEVTAETLKRRVRVGDKGGPCRMREVTRKRTSVGCGNSATDRSTSTK
jgi:hypothetical protein